MTQVPTLQARAFDAVIGAARRQALNLPFNATDDELKEAEAAELQRIGAGFDQVAATYFVNGGNPPPLDLNQIGLQLDAAAARFYTGQIKPE